MKKILSLLLVAAAACSAGAPKKKISSDLKNVNGNNSVRVIVQWTQDASGTAEKIARLGGAVISEFEPIHSGAYLIPGSALDNLEADPDVKFVSVDRKLKKKAVAPGITAATINAPAIWTAGYNGAGVGVAVLDSGINQEDDLGTTVHAPVYTEDFTVPVVVQPDGKLAPKPASYGLDWFGHGQHIAGIIASNGKTSNCSGCYQSVSGISPGVNLINLKVLDVNGEGSDSYVIAAISRAISLKQTYNIRVMNLSLGRPVYESYKQDPLCQAVEAAWRAGIVVVIAAGNDGRDNSFGNNGYATINAPGNDPYVITVGAMKSANTVTRTDDTIASYSSKGPTAVDHIVKPDIVAPGNLIVSLLAQHGTLPLANPQNVATLGVYQNNPPKVGPIPVQPSFNPDSTSQPPAVKIGGGYSNQYYVLSGTSMAAGVVSGAVADLIQANPGITPDQVKILLMQTASKTFPGMSTVVDASTGQMFTSYYDIFTVGAGYLDMQAALKIVKQVPTVVTAVSPTAVYDGSTGNVDLAFDPTSVFSDRAIWGADSVSADRAIWGASGIWGSSVLAGTRAIWGADTVWSATSSTSADRAMWGASGIWADRTVWGNASLLNAEGTMIQGEQ